MTMHCTCTADTYIQFARFLDVTWVRFAFPDLPTRHRLLEELQSFSLTFRREHFHCATRQSLQVYIQYIHMSVYERIKREILTLYSLPFTLQKNLQLSEFKLYRGPFTIKIFLRLFCEKKGV